MKPGNIVILNGTPSAGKSSTARALQAIMSEPHILTGPDHYLSRVPQQFFSVGDIAAPQPDEYFLLLYKGAVSRQVSTIDEASPVFGLGEFADLRIGPRGMDLLAGMYCSIAALSRSGIDVVVDDIFHDDRILRVAVEALKGLPVLFVCLRLPREVAERRERERGDRGPGAVAAFYDRVYARDVYDLTLDTSVLTPEECALQIKEALADGAGPAFDRLRRQFRQVSSSSPDPADST